MRRDPYGAEEEGGDILGSESTDTVAELNHTLWLFFSFFFLPSQPQAFEVVHTSANSVTERKQVQANGSMDTLLPMPPVLQKYDTLSLVLPSTEASAL